MATFLEDEDSVVSIKDIVDEEQALQDTANAVLGDSDDTNCTYTKVQEHYLALNCFISFFLHTHTGLCITAGSVRL